MTVESIHGELLVRDEAAGAPAPASRSNRAATRSLRQGGAEAGSYGGPYAATETTSQPRRWRAFSVGGSVGPTAAGCDARLAARLIEALFDGGLPDVSLSFARVRGACGVEVDGGVPRVGVIHLDPAWVDRASDRDISLRIVHGLVHIWQIRLGRPGRRGYHNQEWSARMRKLGAVPTATGDPGGAQTGDRMAQRLRPGWPVDLLLARLPPLPRSTTAISAAQGARVAAAGRRAKTRYSCRCRNVVWGRPDLAISCGRCGLSFVPQPSTGRGAVRDAFGSRA